MSYLDEWVSNIPRLYILDDYHYELREEKRVNGPLFQFSFGDFVAKSLICSIDPTLHKSDQYYDYDYDDGCDCCTVRRRQRECVLI
jgi:hypothetical protein